MSEQAEKYQRKHNFAPYTKADGNAVAEEFDGVQAHLEKVPALRNDGKGFAENFIIIDPTEDNHPVTYGQLKNAENSVGQNKNLVIQKAEEVSRNAQQVALDTQTAQQAKSLAVSAAQTATEKAQVATEKADIATEKADSITQSATLAEQAKQSALTAESNARKWAANPEDEQVTNGEFSAYHHAVKARKSAERAEAAADASKTTPVENNLTSTSTGNALSAAMGKKLNDEKLGKDEAIFDKRRGYYYSNPTLSGKTVVRINLPANIGLTGIINISVLGSWGSENASGLIEVRGGIGINPGRVWGQSLKCTQMFGLTKSNFYVEPTVHMGSGNIPYIKVHKRKSNNNPIYIYVELISDNGLKNKEITFSVDNSLSVIENKENEVLSSSIDSDSEEQPANSKAVKIVYDKAVEATKKGLPVGAIVSFHKSATPHGYLRAIGGTFNQETYPDLYTANGNSNVLPNLTQSDVGMTAYFATDAIPDGWIAFDSIRTTVTQGKYPELYAHLVAKYGSISNVPLAEDRFIRNAGNGLNVGLTQGDAIRNIVGSHLVDTNVADSAPDGVFRINGGRNGRGYYGGGTAKNLEFNASLVVPTADENRPKSIALKLCIKAKNTFDDVVFWIKAFGVVENVGALNAGSLAQDIQHVDAKARQIEASFNQNKTATDSRIQTIETKLNTESRVIWSGNVTHNNSNILQMSESVVGKTLTFYMKTSSSYSINDSNDLHTCNLYIDKFIMSSSIGKKYAHGAAYIQGGWRNIQIELVNETQLILLDITSMFLKQITAI